MYDAFAMFYRERAIAGHSCCDAGLKIARGLLSNYGTSGRKIPMM